MMIRQIQRAALGGSIWTARLPLDTAVSLLGSESAEIVLDRADAALRDTAGRLLFDDELRQDAARRRAAVAERERALRLRTQAEVVNRDAAERVDERERQAEQRRQAANEQAKRRKQAAARRRDAERERAAKVERSRKQSAVQTEARVEERVESEAQRERLEALEEKAEALESAKDALTAHDEARRLKREASKVKAQRKS